MDFGAPLPWMGPLATPANVRKAAQAFERLDFQFVGCGEHLFYPKEMLTAAPHKGGKLPVNPADPAFEIFTLFSFLAACTERLQFRSAMVVLPYHSPFDLARLAASLDQLSGGRFAMSVALGWMREEFEALNVPFEQRGRIADESLSIIRHLFEGEGPFEGEFHSFPSVYFEPKPTRRPLPIIIGGGAIAPVFRRIARFGQGWWPWQCSVEDVAAARPLLRDAMAAQGRENEPLEIVAYGRFNRIAALGPLCGAQQAVDDLARWAEAGATSADILIGHTGAQSLAEVLDAAQWFAEEVMPVARHFTAAS